MERTYHLRTTFKAHIFPVESRSSGPKIEPISLLVGLNLAFKDFACHIISFHAGISAHRRLMCYIDHLMSYKKASEKFYTGIHRLPKKFTALVKW